MLEILCFLKFCSNIFSDNFISKKNNNKDYIQEFSVFIIVISIDHINLYKQVYILQKSGIQKSISLWKNYIKN